ncbi:MAG: hypothetical protein ACLP7F_10990 [Acidimicrobiales bacterium]
MLPAYVRGPERAAIWITSWLDRLGATAITPDCPVTLQVETSGNVVGVWLRANISFADGRSLHIVVQFDGQLQARRYAFDVITNGKREWGWHGHQEPAAFHHRHLPPAFKASSADPATFEKIEQLFHGEAR